jgi:hypothetical protein
MPGGGGGGGGGEEAFALGPSLLSIFLHSPPFESRNGNIWVGWVELVMRPLQPGLPKMSAPKTATRQVIQFYSEKKGR